MNPYDLPSPRNKPVPSWPAAMIIVGGTVAFLVGSYWLIVHLVNLVGEGVMP